MNESLYRTGDLARAERADTALRAEQPNTLPCPGGDRCQCHDEGTDQ